MQKRMKQHLSSPGWNSLKNCLFSYNILMVWSCIRNQRFDCGIPSEN